MGKLNFKKRRWIVREIKKGELFVTTIAKVQKVSRQYCYELLDKHEHFGDDALRDKQAGRPKKLIPEEIKDLVTMTYQERPRGAVMMEKYIEKGHDIHIPHNQIHDVLLKLGYSKPDPKKRRQRKYCRYERKHSNSLWHVDWKWLEDEQCWIIAYIDDHSRFITGWGKFKEATGENALIVLCVAIMRYGTPRAILTDRGTQFYCSEKKGKKQGITEFQKELMGIGIKHIVGRVQHPQTNGKIERWFGTYIKESYRFSSTERFVEDYNYYRPHMSLNYNAPAEVYFTDFMKMLTLKQ